jgi:AbrB family looped-hinge helix DNA binding protein
MLMKVFNKGQVVIPSAIRNALGIDFGDMLDVQVNKERQSLELRKMETSHAAALAGSLATYGKQKEFPSRRSMNRALQRGLSGEA